MSGKPERDPDERVSLPLDPEVALRALLAVDPDDAADDFTTPKEATPEQLKKPRRVASGENDSAN